MKRKAAPRKKPRASEPGAPQAEPVAGDATGSPPGENAAPDLPAAARDPDQTDIERLDEHKGGSVEGVTPDHSADGVESPARSPR